MPWRVRKTLLVLAETLNSAGLLRRADRSNLVASSRLHLGRAFRGRCGTLVPQGSEVATTA